MPKLVEKFPQAVLLSLLVHLIAIALFVVIKLPNEPLKSVDIFIQLPEVENPAQPYPSIKVTKTISEKEFPAVDIPKREGEPYVESEVVQIDSVKTDSSQKFDRTTFFALAPVIAYKQALEKIHTDSLDTIKVNQPGIALLFDMGDSTQFSVLPGPYQDRIQRDLDQQNLGHQRPLSLNKAIDEGAGYLADLFKKKKTEKAVHLDFIPSDAELDILTTIWQHSKATDVEIYAALDTSIHLTAVDLNDALEQLEKKGLVTKKLVSPRNEFTFPLGQVEMSAKNRKNRVFRYESRIDADEVIRYLQAVLYEAEYGQKNALDSTHVLLIASLKQKILRLLQAKQ